MRNLGIVKCDLKKNLIFFIKYSEFNFNFFKKIKGNYIYPVIKFRKNGILLIYDFMTVTFVDKKFILNNKEHKLFLPL